MSWARCCWTFSEVETGPTVLSHRAVLHLGCYRHCLQQAPYHFVYLATVHRQYVCSKHLSATSIFMSMGQHLSWRSLPAAVPREVSSHYTGQRTKSVHSYRSECTPSMLMATESRCCNRAVVPEGLCLLSSEDVFKERPQNPAHALLSMHSRCGACHDVWSTPKDQ